MVFLRKRIKAPKENKEYISNVNNSGIFDNSYADSLPQTVTADIVRKHFETKSDKTNRALIIGFDGARADSMLLILKGADEKVSGINSDSRYSGIKKIKEAGGLYLTYAGGDKGGYQETSTAQGWSSILTGKWGKENGVILHVPIRENVPTVLRELAEKGYSSSFNASWQDHFTITYSREIEITKINNLPLTFNRVENDEELHEKIKTEITSGTKCIFAIYEAPDYNGHSTKFGNGNYRYVKAVTDLDRCVYEQLSFIESREEYKDENWLIIVTSDHGGHNFGHGKQITEDRATFFACNKKLIEK